MTAPSAPTESKKRRVLVNSTSGVVGLVIDISFILWVYQYLLAKIPPEQFSIYPVLLTVMLLVPIIISLFGSALGRRLVAAYTEGDMPEVTRLHTSAVLALGLGMAVLLALGGVLAFFVDSVLSVPEGLLAETRAMVLLFVADVAIVVFMTPFSIVFEATQRFIERDLLRLIRSLVAAGLTCLLLFTVSVSVVWLPLATLLADVVLLALLVLRGRMIAPHCRVALGSFSRATVQSLIVFGLWTSLGSISSVVRQALGPFLLNAAGTPEDVNSFFLGSVVDRRVFAVMTVALAPIVPVLTQMSVEQDDGALARTFVRGGRYALWLCMIVGAPFYVYSHDIFDLYVGEGYSEAADVAIVMVAAFPVMFSSVMVPRLAIAQERLRAFFIGRFFVMVSTIALAVVAVSKLDYGPVGVALAISGVTVASNVLYFWPLGLRMSGVSARAFAHGTLLLGLLPAAGGLVVWSTLQALTSVDSLFELALHGLAGGIAYIGVLFGFCLTGDERALFRRLTGRGQPDPGESNPAPGAERLGHVPQVGAPPLPRPPEERRTVTKNQK